MPEPSDSDLVSQPVTDPEKDGDVAEETNIADIDPNLVWWDGENDPNNPYNWPTWRKALNCGLVSALSFITPLTSSIFAPGVPQLMRDFHNDNTELASFVVSVFVLGFALGPLLVAPLSEIYGRLIVYHVCNVGFIAFLIACAVAPSLNSLIVFRFFSGALGSAPLTNSGGTVADTIHQEKRGRVMSITLIGTLLGPAVGPVIGGFLANAKGWRWVFWLCTIVAGALGLAMFFCCSETYAPILLERKAQRLRKTTNNPLLRSKLDRNLSPRDYFIRSIVRPIKLLFLSPICTIFAVYLAIVYGYLYLLFTSFSEVFTTVYGFNTGTSGLSYLGIGVGNLCGLVYYSATSDRTMQRMAKMSKDTQDLKPEYRLPLLRVGAVLLPTGLFIYGWTVEYKVQWIVPILGTAIFGIGAILCMIPTITYLVDAFTIYAASAMAANTVIRSIAGSVLPLAGSKMYETLGYGWGNSLLGFIAACMIPVPWVIIRYGEFLRRKYSVENL
ncbi:bicyclomycin resistance protein, putative [Talaromyces stipitatus ATCC 10500]|uniref:Bicyclomycin resistance protein, putative n=1 Tax=Talaromyces stipitatus (strain ATCC 10500 / CBS 375.48 / QM 6759 / NRRL 1006) TaxID=441959 RepID=B8LVA0_TALSN|nr:bicyclomycin resistance protein, putative [Talaromyces stipitatus ATCC 10500]EED23150.1 bicyclomycin resistance protein, putative [Talaromyces stipitatus ATCC 10500]